MVFTPVDDEGGQPATALTATDGTFSLNNADGRKGAVPGNYKVMVSKAEAMELPGGQVPKTPEEIEKMMMKGRGTDRKSPPPAKKSSSGVPARYRSADTPLRQTVPPEGKVIIKLDSKGR